MKKILFPFFISKLIFLNVLFFLKILFLVLSPFKFVVLALMFLLIYLYFLASQLLKLSQNQEEKVFFETKLPLDEKVVKKATDLDEIEKNLETLHNLSPNNEEVNYNLDLLEKY